MLFRSTVCFLLAFPAGVCALEKDAFHEQLLPFVDAHCIDCHDSRVSEGGIDLEPFLTLDELLAEREPWEKVLKQLRAGAMPPDGEPRPDGDAEQKVIAWLEEALHWVDPSKPADPGRVTVRRLNKDEYNRTIGDLFGITLTPADEFPDDNVGYGFDNIGDVLSVSPLRMEQYLNAAESITRNLFYRPDELPLDHTSTVAHYDKHDRKKIRNGSDRGLELIPGGQVSLPFHFPVPGEYEIVVQAWGVETPDPENKGNNERWLDTEKDYAFDPNAPAVGAGEVFIGERKVGRFEAKEGNATVARERIHRIRFDVPAGKHRVYFRHAFVSGIDPQKRDIYLEDPPRAPRVGLRNISLRGPIGPGTAELSPIHQRILEATPETSSSLIRDIASQAFRRPLTDEESDSLARFVEAQQEAGYEFSQALELGLQAVLVSPHFLYRLEWLADPESEGLIAPVGDHALASRLSYFLWGTMPDEELRRLAEKGQLSQPDVTARQVARLLADDRSQAFVKNFFGQWLELRKLAGVRADAELFPEFSSELKDQLQKETLLFAGSIVRENRSALDLLKADYTYINGELAEYYEIPGVPKGQDDFQRVSLAQAPRQGILTHGSILMLTSFPNRTSPTVRGNWILTNILGDEPPPPPADVPGLEDNEAVQEHLSLREQFIQHRTNATCASCHETMDAIGFGLENFNAIGQWRTMDGEFPVDAGGELPTGESFASAKELVEILASREEEFVSHLVSRLLTFALGRGTEYYDRIAIEEILANTQADGYRFQDLIREIALSRPFRLQRNEAHLTDSNP